MLKLYVYVSFIYNCYSFYLLYNMIVYINFFSIKAYFYWIESKRKIKVIYENLILKYIIIYYNEIILLYMIIYSFFFYYN